MKMWRKTALLALMLAGAGNLVGVAPSAYAADGSVLLPVDEAEILILEVLVGRHLGSQGVMGYRHGEQVLLPVGEMASILEMAVTVDPYSATAVGWINEESNVFELDVGQGRLVLGDEEIELSEPILYVDPDDIYVSSEELARWWPVDLDVDLRGMRVKVQPRGPVPLVTRLERERQWEMLGGNFQKKTSYPHRRGEYRRLSWPYLDATVSFDSNRDRSVTKGSFLARNDLAHMSLTTFGGYTDLGSERWMGWMRAERSDPEGGLLGPLGATRVQFGDVVSQARQFLNGTSRGRGALVSNRPLGAVTEFGATDVTGDAPPGWEAELYRDGYLYAIQTVSGAGTYLFESIPVHPGLNTMRVVLYGPNGQRREEMQTVNITSSMWRPGQFTYEWLSHQSGESVMGTRTSLNDNDDTGAWAHSLSMGYGLARSTSLDLAMSRRQVMEQDHNYLHARILQSVDRVLLEGRSIHDIDGGDVLSLSAQTRLGRHSLLLSHSRFEDFQSDDNQYEQGLRNRSEARLNGSFRRGNQHLANYRLDWQGSDYGKPEIDRRDQVRLYLGRSLGRFQLSHDLDYTRSRGEVSTDALFGRLQTSGFLYGARVRFDLDYDLKNDPGLNAAGMGLNWNLSREMSAQLSAQKILRGNESTAIQGNIDWQLNPVRFGLRAGYDTESGEYIGLSATTSITRAPQVGWKLSSRTSSEQGAAMAHAFIDANGNGAFDDGDQPMDGVSFGRNPLWRDIRTDEEGVAFLPGVPADRFVNVVVNLESVEDPYLVTENEGLTTLVHAGGVSKLSYPFQVVGEIEGLVVTSPGMRPLRNVGLELLDADGNRVSSAVSEFDGYYLFDRVKPGAYTLRVVMSTLRDGLYHEPEAQPVSVPEMGDYVTGPTVVLERVGVVDEPQVAVVETQMGTEEAGEDVAQADTGAAIDAPADAPVGAPVARADERAAAERAVASSSPRTPELPVVAELAPSQGPAADPDVNRTLHLIHELLFASPMFQR